MENFEFYSPTKVIFGKDAELQVGAEIASRAVSYTHLDVYKRQPMNR